ncbi:ABC transporter permease subunit [Fictibacillus aquaticus]|uniref:ABC transporter permease n=1 Tax=Fictibacillus aquaticus TaxID=2021314 RepID=A0A235F679_9BACL|nr:ABC transporter permease subunit [Fictibacillus aquaticus]OYD56654.1 ABC transporter permease [Fictibacillus aquaticus]
MNMFIHELKSARKSILIWSLALVGITVLFLSIFPSISRDADEFKRLIEGYPEGVLKAVGLQINTITSFLGFYSYMFLYVMLCGAIQAMNLGAGIVAKETSGKTAEFLLTKPVTRLEILAAKWRAVLVSLVITNIVFVAAASFMANFVAVEGVDVTVFLLISASNFIIQLVFAALGIFLAVVLKRIRSVLTLSLSTIMVFFVLSVFGSIVGEEGIRYVTPFKYFDYAYIAEHSAYEARFLVLGLVLVVMMLSASFWLFSKKDIHSI